MYNLGLRSGVCDQAVVLFHAYFPQPRAFSEAETVGLAPAGQYGIDDVTASGDGGVEEFGRKGLTRARDYQAPGNKQEDVQRPE